MNRHDILTEADRLTSTDRNKNYGPPRLNHERIAAVWSMLLGIDVTPSQVALCMAGVKLARLAQTPDHLDSFIDGAAYMAIAGEIATEGEPCVTSADSLQVCIHQMLHNSPSSSTTAQGMRTISLVPCGQSCPASPAPTY